MGQRYRVGTGATDMCTGTRVGETTRIAYFKLVGVESVTQVVGAQKYPGWMQAGGGSVNRRRPTDSTRLRAGAYHLPFLNNPK